MVYKVKILPLWIKLMIAIIAFIGLGFYTYLVFDTLSSPRDHLNDADVVFLIFTEVVALIVFRVILKLLKTL